jgi:hypothetical protein
VLPFLPLKKTFVGREVVFIWFLTFPNGFYILSYNFLKKPVVIFLTKVQFPGRRRITADKPEQKRGASVGFFLASPQVIFPGPNLFEGSEKTVPKIISQRGKEPGISIFVKQSGHKAPGKNIGVIRGLPPAQFTDNGVPGITEGFPPLGS